MKNTILAKFGENVRTLCNALGISQEELAERAELHRTCVGGIERGERNVALINIVAPAKGLGYTPTELLRGMPK